VRETNILRWFLRDTLPDCTAFCPWAPQGDFVPHCGAKQTLKLKAGHTISVVVEDKTVI